MSEAPRRVFVLYSGCYLSGRHTSIGLIAGKGRWAGDRIHGPITVGGVDYQVHVQITRARSFLLPHAPIEELLGDESIQREFEAMRRIEAVVFVADPMRDVFNAEMLELLRRDLVAAGRDPAAIPVVFQLNKQDLVASGFVPPLDRASLSWPICDYVESIAVQGEGVKRALERAIELAVGGG